MSNVTLSIGGKRFTVACADGEEAHVGHLGTLIDAKVTAAGATGQTEARMMLYAALLLADEVHELKGRQTPAAVPAELQDRLASMAVRIENLADLLEGSAANA
ncbi:cell division protein ZapA [Novosphingobium album (ex Hu et al. 2023)]|uniref:Cell division protein ZapA n=1 Tax=Novosphingobium album (ex Hu et al. 2023) TaxID=2930093 RepID=A0ABT0AXN6_9SPHN|nr:cell division protein ZapA [Novosphingobium album (ex Hu et al. 2023)]MCJ2177388.1 cell division protein ZapA [Novosphingobium album (ex Hu et al. 2023)]